MSEWPLPTPGYTPVTSEQFYDAVGDLNVHPRVDVPSLKGRYAVCHWEHLNTRHKFGWSASDMWGVEPSRYAIYKAKGDA